jgi:hypothetical protein
VKRPNRRGRTIAVGISYTPSWGPGREGATPSGEMRDRR